MSMKKSLLPFLFLAAVTSTCTTPTQSFLKLDPENHHYFLFNGQPEILIGSTEHYGAVLNLDFNYIKYLNEVAASGLNVTRTFSGIYVEPLGAFGIEGNTLAPANGRFICPWARSSTSGYANGGNKFDLTKWDERYFSRLKDFLTEAANRNIVVELDLFSNFYDKPQWNLSPLYVNNNINNIGNIEDQKEILSLRHPKIVKIQEQMVRKIVSELRNFGNMYYEICNEPYFGDTLALREWENHMTGIVIDAEKDFPEKHLISNNIANNHLKLEKPRTGVSIYNFHYARPPVTVGENYELDRVIGDNETGFDGIDDAKYRLEAWNFILAGGGLFNNLDYSFTAGREDGTFIVNKTQPGGGGKTLRNQFRIMAEFMKSFDFVKSSPVIGRIIGSGKPGDIEIRALSGKNKLYAVYFSRKDTASKSLQVEIDLSPGSYLLTWTDTKTGKGTTDELNEHNGGNASITTPVFSQDIALLLRKSH